MRRTIRDLLLVGAGGFGREAAATVRAINAIEPTWRLLGFLDDDPALQGGAGGSVVVLGPVEAAHDHPNAQLAICTGNPSSYSSRQAIAERLDFEDDRYATLVHPTATVGDTCRIGAGSVLLAHADLTADVVVGRHVITMPQVVLTHDVRIEDFCTLNSGARIGGKSHVEQGAYIATGACIRDHVRVGARAMVGMGSVVTTDVPADRMWYGTPARDISAAPALLTCD
jgi:sugar O-acyltransferase (sialic acid O-acetyltransferase NeuD family)